MRALFAKKITSIANENKKVVLLSGDIGNRMFDEFKANSPDRFINCGIAEANMMSIASGLALTGLRPVIYTITPFLTIRCLEQIKIGVSYHQSPVLIIGTGSGLSYGELGPTHHSLEDISLLTSIPGIRVLAPCDPEELSYQLDESIKYAGPTYIRIGKKGEPNLYLKNKSFQIGKANIIKEGDDACLFGIGPILSNALEASEELNSSSLDLKIVSMGSVWPLDENILNDQLNQGTNLWFTLEEHCIYGGLGSKIAQWLETNDHKRRIKLVRLGTPNDFIHNLGNQSYLREVNQLNSKSIFNRIFNEIEVRN